MNTASFTLPDAAYEATRRLRNAGYPDATVRVRNLPNLEQRNALGPWPRDSTGRRQLTNEHIDEIVRYFAGHYQAQGRYPIDITPTTDREDRA